MNWDTQKLANKFYCVESEQQAGAPKNVVLKGARVDFILKYIREFLIIFWLVHKTTTNNEFNEK